MVEHDTFNVVTQVRFLYRSRGKFMITLSGISSLFDELDENYRGDDLYRYYTFDTSSNEYDHDKNLNIFIDSDDNFNAELIALGFDESDIKVSYENGYFIINMGKSDKETETEKINYTTRGFNIKKKTIKFRVDYSKYDINKTELRLKNGILTIKIPILKTFIKSKTFGFKD